MIERHFFPVKREEKIVKSPKKAKSALKSKKWSLLLGYMQNEAESFRYLCKNRVFEK